MSDVGNRHSPSDGTPGEPAGSRSADTYAPQSTGPEPDVDTELYERPPGVVGAFAPYFAPPPTVAPAPPVSPAEQAVFGRPSADAAFAPAPGERIMPRQSPPVPVPPIFADAFGATPDARDGFAPAAGSRLPPTAPSPGSPWWKPDAPRDPWRDPQSPFWLGRGAVFTRGVPAQLDPDQDEEAGEPTPDGEAEAAASTSDNVRHVRFGARTLTLAVAALLLAGLVGGTVSWWLTDTVRDGLHRPDVQIAQVATPAKRAVNSVAGIAKRVGPTVVSIAVKTSTQFGIGSGVVIDRDGDVLTNNHVVAAAAGAAGASIVVTFSDESTAKAQIVGRDPVSDLAVIKVPDDQLTVAQLGNSRSLVVGDPVIAIGSPLGLQGTVTAGIVSALDRPVHVYSDDGSSDAYLDAIQTDAPINPGNSGGALVNGAGAVIGINSAAALGSSGPNGAQRTATGIGYAIPINYARDIALQLIHAGSAQHASIGAQGVTALAGTQVGGYIKQVSPNGSAAKAGLRPGDVVVVADNTQVQTFDQLIVIVQRHKPGDRISVTYFRGSAKRTAIVTLDKA